MAFGCGEDHSQDTDELENGPQKQAVAQYTLQESGLWDLGRGQVQVCRHGAAPVGVVFSGQSVQTAEKTLLIWKTLMMCLGLKTKDVIKLWCCISSTVNSAVQKGCYKINQILQRLPQAR